ncbi:hypothetical protein GT037_001221 [Alternaria burnsii]|uniref:Uncharacterized protein n=1 Tax=Alternaria burnsii TaxID=1187904 RepID=A0A8H7BDS4_9PLEO|nr:uncharacterized protein GT037_001221 [Alternaria burnsii]KAF7682245.1 hypothetical protein GT037_001221 [Alternaria burnsii]
MTASTTKTATVVSASNQHDHIIGHCRAQRHTLYSCSESCIPVQLKSSQKPTAIPQLSEDTWTDSQEELERWGMEATEMTKPESSQTATPNDTHGGGLKYEEVARFWQ